MTLQDMDILLAQEREEYLSRNTVHAALLQLKEKEFRDKLEVAEYLKEFAKEHQEFLKENDYGLAGE